MKKYYHIFLVPIGFIALAFLLSSTGVFTAYPSEQTMVNSDAGWYRLIAEVGYTKTPQEGTEQHNIAFFPLFAYVWKALGTSFPLILAFNILVFLVSQIILMKYWQMTRLQSLCMMSFSSLLFCYVPYSESLFYFFGTFILVGLKNDKVWLTAIGLLCCGLTRSASLFFVPALIFVIITRLHHKEMIHPGKELFMALAAVSSIFIVALIQFQVTGVWFGFVEAQKAWGNHLQVPRWPLYTWNDQHNLMNDGMAFMITIFALYHLIRKFYFFLRRKQSPVRYSAAFYFSATLLAELGVYVLLYRGGSLFSLNRFVFASPFLAVFTIELLKNNELTRRQVLYGVLAVLTFFELAFGVWWGRGSNQLRLSIHFVLLTVVSFFWMKSTTKNWALITVTVLNFALQLHYFHRWISGNWVG